ncbi:MAG: IS1634 family transposase [Gammaproteobacteria bacterium]|nr:IS1634 family transposase [Gammaproteobacteria bacterium]
MFLRATSRKKDGKFHRYFSVVENRRVAGGRVVQRHVLYLGEINSSQERAWRRSIEVIEDGVGAPRTVALFPEDRVEGLMPDASIVRLRLSAMRLKRPRQWGACWLVLMLWQRLDLDVFFAQRLPRSRKGTRWDLAVFVLAAYRLISPGSEWRLHRQWYGGTALGDLIGSDEGLVDPHVLYGVHDRLLAHKAALFTHLTHRWRDLFNASYEVLLYDLTSTYFESDPPLDEHDQRRHGYSRDHRPDCVQIVIALIVTPEGLPVAYEVLPGNAAESTTLRGFLQRIEHQYGKAQRIWCMDRGIPTEAVLEEMRASDPPVQYLVGTPKGRLNRLESALLTKPWRSAREGVKVKLLPEDGELYVYAESRDRIAKERSMRRRLRKWLWARLAQLGTMDLSRDALLMRLGQAQAKAPAAWRLVEVMVHPSDATFAYTLNRAKLSQVRRREGRYLLRTNLTETDPVKLWEYYLQLVRVEEAFRTLKSDLAIRPIFHQLVPRIEAHVFLSFLAYCLYVTLGRTLHPQAPGLTARSALEKFAAMQMVDVHLPTTDGRELILTRYTEPERELQLLLERLNLTLPPQPKPRITAAELATATAV